MRAEAEQKINDIQSSLTLIRQRMGWEVSRARLTELTELSTAADFWDDQAQAQKVMREKNGIEVAIKQVEEIETRLKDATDMLKLASSEGDDGLEEEVMGEVEALAGLAMRRRLESLLSGEADDNDCYVEIHAGAGGTEAQDWAEMLVRMYARWGEAHGYKIDHIAESPGEEAGIKSQTMRFRGMRAYGWMKSESGVHRLVRLSPYDSSGRRHTSFASVWVYPAIDDTIKIDIDDKDLRIDTYRASGAGGQHVNRTDSACRITHLPTGIVVQCQNDRSQHRNKATAMAMLKARLYERELQKQEEKTRTEAAGKSEIGWGSQIRSYVLHPYQMVKDLRTQVEKGNAQSVLDGDIDAFLEAGLAHRVGG